MRDRIWSTVSGAVINHATDRLIDVNVKSIECIRESTDFTALRRIKEKKHFVKKKHLNCRADFENRTDLYRKHALFIYDDL